MKALVIDDERDARDSLCAVLETAGWTVELAEDGIAGLGRVPQVRPDVILLDVRMPHLDGVGLLAMLRSTEYGRTVPVVLVTGADVSDEVRALADAVLMKPFDPRELLRVAARLGAGPRKVPRRS
ncbi:MAG TPA: response regulator [Anaeromyxobacter sp.]|nr:response regulator [Anaeromyxobacter sp.]